MAVTLEIPTSVAGLAAAAACVIAGGPLFADGLRTLRLRHLLARLRERPLAEDCTGLVQVRGRVALESPLFAPLSARACAGFLLEVRGAGTRAGGTIREQRAFRLVAPGGEARVLPEGARWEPPVTAERTIAPGDTVSGHLAALLASLAETRWLRARGTTLHVVERALEAGATATVIGVARHARPYEVAGAVELQRTGTDGGAVVAGGPTDAGVDLWIEPGEPLDLLVVSAGAPDRARLAPPRWREALALLGPAISLAGLLYLARAAGGIVGSF